MPMPCPKKPKTAQYTMVAAERAMSTILPLMTDLRALPECLFPQNTVTHIVA